MNSCELGRWETGSVGGNKITFDGNLGDTGNPLKFPFQKWPVKMYLDIIASHRKAKPPLTYL